MRACLVCNLYRFEPAQYAFDFKIHPSAGNPAPDYVGADSDGPVIVNMPEGRELTRMRWGFPPDEEFNKAGKRNKPRTNIRKVSYRARVWPLWMLPAEQRCLVPFERFAEPIPRDHGGGNAWFETATEHSFFAGVWRHWSGNSRLVPVEGKKNRQRTQADLNLFAILTTDANSVVAPVHPKAMPVVLTEPEECDAWLAGGEGSFSLQRPLADDLLQRVESIEQ